MLIFIRSYVIKMVRPSYRSHSKLRIIRRVPGNTTKLHHIRRKPSPAHCPVTGEVLRGVPCLRPAQIRKLPKSARRPNRPYGGKVSSKALANAILSKVIAENISESASQDE